MPGGAANLTAWYPWAASPYCPQTSLAPASEEWNKYNQLINEDVINNAMGKTLKGPTHRLPHKDRFQIYEKHEKQNNTINSTGKDGERNIRSMFLL